MGQYRKPKPHHAGFSAEDNDELLGLLNDPIFAGTPPKKKAPSGKEELVCLNCGLTRLEVEANFCDGCGERFAQSKPGRQEEEEEDNLDDVISLDDSEKAFLEANGTSEAEIVEVKKELVRVSTFHGGPPADKKRGPGREPPPPPAAGANASFLNTSLATGRRSSRR